MAAGGIHSSDGRTALKTDCRVSARQNLSDRTIGSASYVDRLTPGMIDGVSSVLAHRRMPLLFHVAKREPAIHVVVDSSGVEVYGETPAEAPTFDSKRETGNYKPASLNVRSSAVLAKLAVQPKAPLCPAAPHSPSSNCSSSSPSLACSSRCSCRRCKPPARQLGGPNAPITCGSSAWPPTTFTTSTALFPSKLRPTPRRA